MRINSGNHIRNADRCLKGHACLPRRDSPLVPRMTHEALARNPIGTQTACLNNCADILLNEFLGWFAFTAHNSLSAHPHAAGIPFGARWRSSARVRTWTGSGPVTNGGNVVLPGDHSSTLSAFCS